MDPVWKMLLDNVFKPAWADRNFIALVFMCWQLRAQKITFHGMFKTQDVKIANIEKTADRSERKSDEAIKSVGEIKPKFDNVYEWWEQKFKNGVEDAQQKESQIQQKN